MGQGQGSISVNQKAPVIPVPVPPGPPFALNSADNGLSVDPVTGEIVLGQTVGAIGDPAQLLSNREIPLQAFDFALGSFGNRRLLIDQFGLFGQDWLGDVDGAGIFGFAVHVDNNNGIINLGDYNGTFTGTSFFIDDSGRTFQMFDNRGSYFFIGNSSLGVFPADYQLGDIDDVDNGMSIKIDNRAATARIRLGNIGAVNNGNVLTIDDVSSIFGITNSALNAIVNINGVNGFTGTVTPVVSITVDGGIVTNVT
jgi:hypothetical protein